MRAIILVLLLAGCASNPSIQPVKTVEKVVRVPCVDQVPAEPKLSTDAELKAMPDYEATLTLLRERIEREIYERKLQAILAGCL